MYCYLVKDNNYVDKLFPSKKLYAKLQLLFEESTIYAPRSLLLFGYIRLRMKLFLISLVVLLVNIPFGYWRANVQRFTLQWFLAIHLPVIVVIVLRLVSHLGFAWFTYVVLVTAFFLGQRFGALIIRRVRKVCDHATSCMVMDILKCRRQL